MTTQQTLALFSNHHLYYWIARSNLETGEGCETELKANEIRDAEEEQYYVRRTGRPDPDDAAMAAHERNILLDKKCVSLTQACVFAGMAVEAFINFYPRWKSQPGSLLVAVDDLPLVSKWLVTPALINEGQRLNPGHQPMQDLRFLVTTRNRLVHSTPRAAILFEDGQAKPAQSTNDGIHGPSLNDARRCVHTVKAAVMALTNIDPSIRTDWLEQDRFHSLYPVQKPALGA